MIKKTMALILIILLSFSIVGCKGEASKVYDANNEIIADVGSTDAKDRNYAYLDIVVNEAAEKIAQLNNCDTEKAKKLLLNGNYDIYTYADQNLISVIVDAYEKTLKEINFGCVITDLGGRLTAAYSSSHYAEENFATKPQAPYSALKPLSVYAPAIEKGIINWSSLFEDSPHKKIENESGEKSDWPSNATNTYSYKTVVPYEAVKKSLNTVAVKSLDKYGVDNSIEFLESSFNLSLEEEKQRSFLYGEEAIIGNIALGYVQAGVSPAELAGCYQIFANGGKYKYPSAIKKITDKKGNIIYEDKTEMKQVISAETSYIMNEMLRGVVTKGGTGEKAYSRDIQVAGKTGTGDNHMGNWFVGITPEYSCAVWHSRNEKNCAAEIFSKITSNANIENKVFMTSENVEKHIYCKESGKLFSTKCKSAEMGYYAKNRIPDICDEH